MKILGLITARGGSKGIPQKNIKLLAGKPLIAYSIEAASKSKIFAQAIVSTDDKKIAQISRHFQAQVPFMRPKKLAGDQSPHIDVIVHALIESEKKFSCIFDYVMLLQPTSPLRTVEDIQQAVALLKKSKTSSVVSVEEASTHPFHMRIIDKKNKLKQFINVPKGYLPRQKLPKIYSMNGAIYLANRNLILKKKKLMDTKTQAYVMPAARSIDINTPYDLRLAELILQGKLK